MTLSENFKIVNLLAPAADAAGRAGDYFSVKHAMKKAFVVCKVNQGNAATVAFTLSQATHVAGTADKALTGNVSIWANEDTVTSDTLVKQTDAKAFTTSAAVKSKIVVFEIDIASALDINNGFDCITVTTGASNAANITEATLYLPLATPGQTSTQPSVIID
jgi:hypothetical protein